MRIGAEGRLSWSLWAFLLFISICSPLARCDTSADLELTKMVDNSAPYEGNAIAYTITVTNRGPDAATGVEVTDLLPPEVTYVSHRASQGIYEASTGLWMVDALAVYASATLEITVTIDSGTAGSAVANTAEVTRADQSDPDSTPGNNYPSEDDLGSARITVPRPAAETMGSLYAFIALYPQTAASEVSSFAVDMRVDLNFSMTLSGLMISNASRFDAAGLEYEAIMLRAVLGGFQINDQLTLTSPGSGELAFQGMSLNLEGRIYGLSIRNLAVWTIETLSSRFEDTILIRGSTAGGATITSETKLCLSAACSEGLSYERLTISGLSLAGIALRSVTTFKPAEPVEERLTLQFKIANLATVNASVKIQPDFEVSSTVTATNELWSIVLNYDSQLNLSRETITLLLPLAPGLSIRSTTTVIPALGIDEILTSAVRTELWELSNTTIFKQSQFQSTEFSLRTAFSELGFTMSARFTPECLEYVSVSLGMGF